MKPADIPEWDIDQIRCNTGEEEIDFMWAREFAQAIIAARDSQWDAAVEALEKENERLREALELVVVSIRVGSPEYDERDTLEIARAALEVGK